jgi:hypothetical protein
MMMQTTKNAEAKMKKILWVLMVLMLWVCPVWADGVDDALPENTGLEVRNNTRQMVRLGMSEDTATRLTRAMLQHRFQERHIIQAQKTIMETMQTGLPVEPVMNKAFEGMAKNVPDERIVQAMKTTRSRYANAYRKARELTPDEETQNRLGLLIAQGLGAGLQDKDVESVMAKLQIRTRQMSQNNAGELCLQTFATARTMARLGVDSDKVSGVLRQALHQQFSAGEMQQLGSSFNDQSQQTSSNQVAAQFAQKLGQGEKPGQSGSNQDSGGKAENASGSLDGSKSESGHTGRDDSDAMGGSKEGGSTGGGSSGGGGGSNGAAGGNGKK